MTSILRPAAMGAALLGAVLPLARPAMAADERYGGNLGRVEFPVSCGGEAASEMERGLALLHHMTYMAARAAFERATARDPDCAMGYWGQAMTYIHPLWSDPPSEEDFGTASALLETAATTGRRTAREEAYIEALRSYFSLGRGSSEKPNLTAYAEGWKQAHSRFSEDPEIRSLYALAHLATADPDDKSYAVQNAAADIAAPVLQRIPDHPGAHHYIIHSYDYPTLAEKGLKVARSYGAIAPTVPHALHMPSHIFVRLGLWDETITMNSRSADAAKLHPVGDQVSLHYLHALDYLAYAHLQRGEDDKAAEVLATMEAIEKPLQPHVASAYTLAAVPARPAMERHDWKQAAALKPRLPVDFPWDKFPQMEAITYFARGIGAARSGDLEQARSDVERLEVLQRAAQEGSGYWGKQVAIMRGAVQAWLARASGDEQEGLRLMRQAADLESTTEKHPITPGEILPARELLGDMLLEMNRPEKARREYALALQRSPRRLNSLYGSGRAAEMAGDRPGAMKSYSELLEFAAPDSSDPRLQRARRVVGGN